MTNGATYKPRGLQICSFQRCTRMFRAKSNNTAISHYLSLHCGGADNIHPIGQLCQHPIDEC
uniref:Uncharacterized protein n=1 Tax=Arundo donax TaxID=35708 RepID=A0A0A8YUR7_ARUDO